MLLRFPPYTLLHAHLLSLVRSTKSLSQTQQIHAFSLLHNLLPSSISLSASLLLSYSHFHHPITSLSLFHQALPFSRSAFLWNTLLRVLSASRVNDTLRTYNLMVRSRIRPDDYTFPFVLKACADGGLVEKGLEVHGVVFKVGFDSDVFVGNTLLLFYGNCGRAGDAVKVFDEMAEKDVVSWNTVIGVFSVNGWCEGAVEMFRQMVLGSGFCPNFVTVVTVLPVCAGLEDEAMTTKIHCFVVKVGLDSRVTVGNALIDAYGKCGEVEGSRRVFDEMVERNEVSWNSIITSLSFLGQYTEALEMFRLMVGEGVKPNTITISSMLPVLVELGFFNLGKEVHGVSFRLGVESDIFIANSLIDKYGKCGQSLKASNVFYHIDEKNVVSWNAMIANLAQNGFELEAMEHMRQMQAKGEVPNSMTYTNALPACSRMGLLLPGKEIHARSIRKGCISELFVSNALTDMYAKCGSLSVARSVFSISQKDEVSYNILIVGYSQTTDCSESLRLFSEMGLAGMKHDVVSFMGAISACANLAALEKGKQIHGFVIRKCLNSHLFIANSLLDLYIKCGQIDIANRVFHRIMNKDAASWNSMILGYAMLGELNIALDLFEAMKKDGTKCDSVSYIIVLSACSHGGLVQKGKKFFEQMHVYNVKPTHMHYACMVDLLGRSGLLEEAVEFIKKLPIEPDANIWGALLGASRIHGNMDLARWAAKHLFRLKPHHSGYYAILSDMHAEAGNWDEAIQVREMMKSLGVQKNPGYSWVQMDDQVHSFVFGDRMI